MEITEISNREVVPRNLEILLKLCCLLGLILMVGFFTDYSWSNDWANLLYPILVGGLCLGVYRKYKLYYIARQRRLIVSVCCLPSIVVGAFYALVFIVALLPPFSFATSPFSRDAFIGGIVVQRLPSPDSNKIAEVHYKPQCSTACGVGNVSIKLKYPYLPFVQRDIKNMGRTDSDYSRNKYIQWLDNSKILIIDDGAVLEVGFVRLVIPQLIQALVQILFYWISMLITQIA